MRKLKRGSGRYGGKLPFKCFKCGRIGHYDPKFPYGKSEDSDYEKKHRNRGKFHKKEDLSKINVYNLKKIVAHHHIVMKMCLMIIKKNSYSWPYEIRKKY